jgi:hypothetical protein
MPAGHGSCVVVRPPQRPDQATVGYALDRSDGTKDLWSVPADGSGRPARLLTDAFFPAALG